MLMVASGLGAKVYLSPCVKGTLATAERSPPTLTASPMTKVFLVFPVWLQETALARLRSKFLWEEAPNIHDRITPVGGKLKG